MGLVLTIQARPSLAKFGADAMLPGMVAVSLIREMGPVITALICAGKIGSGIGAELGSMKVTEQIEAMEVSATNPMRFLVVTRGAGCNFDDPNTHSICRYTGNSWKLGRCKYQRGCHICPIFLTGL